LLQTEALLPMSTANTLPQRHKTALILSGGGARAAYQVGVLKAIGELLPHHAPNPFPIICGTSAGAVIAVALACHANEFHTGVRRLEHVWRNFTAEQVYRTDVRGLARGAFRWFSAMFMGGIGAHDPVSLLDNTPLRELLGRVLDFSRIQHAIDENQLQAIAVTASGYTSSESISFFQAHENIKGWRRSRRVGLPTQLTLDHLLASSAIPVIFPAVKINREYFGDGAVRQLAPISPALRLGADRVVVIGVSANLTAPRARDAVPGYPSIAHIASHILNSAFLDSLEGDIERLHRINKAMRAVPEEIRREKNIDYRPVELFEISPSQPLDAIASRHAHELPRTIRFFLSGTGATESGGASITSYLLFQKGFCRDLIQLGYHDAMQRGDALRQFLLDDAI
jgi:NTE family protein